MIKLQFIQYDFNLPVKLHLTAITKTLTFMLR